MFFHLCFVANSLPTNSIRHHRVFRNARPCTTGQTDHHQKASPCRPQKLPRRVKSCQASYSVTMSVVLDQDRLEVPWFQSVLRQSEVGWTKRSRKLVFSPLSSRLTRQVSSRMFPRSPGDGNMPSTALSMNVARSLEGILCTATKPPQGRGIKPQAPLTKASSESTVTDPSFNRSTRPVSMLTQT